MPILVTGGAGYIGSITVEALVAQGREVVVFDNLSMGHREAVHPAATFIRGDLGDLAAVRELFRSHEIEGVFHFASRTLVGESNEHPFLYLGDNVRNALNLLETMVEFGAGRLILSSTANLFDDPETMPIAETERIVPGSPYGESKFFIERILHWLQVTKGLRYAALRYFNAAGATEERGEDHTPETHLIPLTLQVALGQREGLQIFGDDYDTPDGTCVRDYIHVQDLADAHLRAYRALDDRESLHFNLGNGAGFSVHEVIETARTITGHEIPAKVAPRRPGDPGTLIADSSAIREELGWEPKFADLERIVESAWRWHQAHPNGYGGKTGHRPG